MSNGSQSATQTMPVSIWIYVRLIVPAGPILIQYVLYALDLFTPPFPQATFILLLFTLALVTATEYQSLASLIYGSIIPALAATILYTAYILTIDNPSAHQQTLLVGFYLWVLLFTINLLRVLLDIKSQREQNSETHAR